MKNALKLVSLAALTAATLALPAAAEDMKDPAKCKAATGMSKCSGKCAGKCGAKMSKHGVKKHSHKHNTMKCGAMKCGAKN